MDYSNIPIILASASPRRVELLKQAGFTFTTRPSTIEENRIHTAPDKLSEELAFQKANDVYQTVKKECGGQDFMVIGADTIVYYDQQILGKPKDEADAFRILKMLSDRTHQVYTGIAVIRKWNGTKQTYLFSDRTDVTFYSISDSDIQSYIDSGDCMDKAGAYGIQGPFAIHVKGINGDYNNVVGLPIAKLYHALQE